MNLLKDLPKNNIPKKMVIKEEHPEKFENKNKPEDFKDEYRFLMITISPPSVNPEMEKELGISPVTNQWIFYYLEGKKEECINDVFNYLKQQFDSINEMKIIVSHLNTGKLMFTQTITHQLIKKFHTEDFLKSSCIIIVDKIRGFLYDKYKKTNPNNKETTI